MDCRLCAKGFGKMYHCNIHKKLHGFMCKDCQKQFYSEQDLKEHENDHVEFKRMCKICNVTIVGQEFYAYHRYVHMRKTLMQTNKYLCDNCSRTFTYEKAFKAHRFNCDNKPTHLYCDLCSAKSFKRKFDLEQHVRKHTSECTYTCKFCYKGFLTKSNFLVHLGSHGVVFDDHPFKCEYCEKVFSKQYNLERHVLRFHYENSSEEVYAQLIGLEIELLEQ